MALEGRCDVETWGEFGFSGISCSPKVVFGDQTDIFICTGCDEVCVFSITEKKLSAVLHFPGSVSDLVPIHDKQLLYVACMTGVYCVPLQFLLSRGQSSQADVSSCPAELKVPSEFLAVPDEGVLSLLLVGSVLLTVSLRHTSWIITLYSQKQSFPSSYEMLTSFSLPLVLSAVYNVTGGLSEKRRPVLVCVHSTTTPSSSSASQSQSITSGHFCLELVLFKLLFGIDVALAKSPVVLCGLPDGRLYFLPLHLPGSRLQILHSLEQPVIFVGPSALDDTGPGKAQCLVAVGEQGKVVLIKTKEGGPEEGGNTTGFIERRLPGPVICGCINKNSLYYSIGSDLLKLDLSYGLFGSEDKERKDEASSKKGTAFQSPTSLNVCRVISLAELTGNTAGKVQLLALSLNGQLQRITLPVKSGDTRLCMEPSGQVGRSVRDLLSAIGDVCERASTLKSDIKSKNQILKCLNQVLNISFLLTATAKSDLDIQEKPIRCHAVTKWSRLLQKDSLTLTCVLDNSSPYVLEQGWTLCVNVFPLWSSPSEVGENSSTNLLFPFNNIHPGETLEVSLPLAAAGEVPFPMTVSCSLIFSLSSLLGKATTNCPGLQSSCISLPLNTLTVDWLHTLKVIGPVPTQTTATSQWCDTTTDAIQAFLSSRQFRCNRKEESPLKPEQHSASVKVSSELLRNILVLRNSDLDGRGGTCAPQNVCVSLLEWLLLGQSGGVRRVHQGDEISSSGVSAQGPNEHTVKLTAEEVNVGEESTGRQESPTTVVLQIESTSVAAVCGLHHAVLRRLQTLLQNVPETAASPTSLQSLGLRQTLHRVEHLLQQIQCTQVSGAFGVGVSTGQMSRSLLSVYRELRENPLIII